MLLGISFLVGDGGAAERPVWHFNLKRARASPVVLGLLLLPFQDME